MSEYMWLEPTRHQVKIYGRVIDKETELPIHGAVVEMKKKPLACNKREAMKERSYRKITAVDGYFYFTDLPDGDYTLSGLLPKAGTRYGKYTDVKVTVSKEGKKEYDIKLPPTGIKGKITNKDGKPVAMAKIKIEGSSESALSDNQGRYLLSNLEVRQGKPKERTVRVSAQEDQSMSQSIELVCGHVKEVNFNFKKLDKEEEKRQPTGIQGKITNKDGAAVVKATIKIEGIKKMAQSNYKGNYVLSNLEVPQGGDKGVTVSVSANDYQPKDKSIDLVLGQVQRRDFQLERKNEEK